jgi:hypothetical protein
MGKYLRRATWDDFYNTLDFPEYKKGLAIIKELESRRLRAGWMRGVMYIKLSGWEEEGHVTSRLEDLADDAIGIRRREYRLVPSARRPDEKFSLNGIELVAC